LGSNGGLTSIDEFRWKPALENPWAKQDCSFMEATEMKFEVRRNRLNYLKAQGRSAFEFLSRSKWIGLATLVLAIMAPFGAKAQIGGSAAIQGEVIDTTGAAVVGAKVVAKSDKTGAEIVRISDKKGSYNLTPLDVDDYTITVTATGFETLVRTDIHVDGMETLALDLTLRIGAMATTVTVTDVPPALETENATLGTAMESEVYQSLPLEMGAAASPDQRRATDFAALMPGVTANETKNNETDEPMVINGNQNSSEMYLEGIPMTSVSTAGDPRYIWSAFSVETVNQFQLKTSAYSAEYRGLGIENYTIKSGGNQFHGTVYDVIRNTAFDAIGFLPGLNAVATAASKAAGGGNVYLNAPPTEHMNEYGISLGGPIIKNKLFFFANYLGFRYSTVSNPAFLHNPHHADADWQLLRVAQPIPGSQDLRSHHADLCVELKLFAYPIPEQYDSPV